MMTCAQSPKPQTEAADIGALYRKPCRNNLVVTHIEPQRAQCKEYTLNYMGLNVMI